MDNQKEECMLVEGPREGRIPEAVQEGVLDILIHKVLNGFVVKVGCQTVVFTEKLDMLAELGRYYDNPQAVKDEYMKKYGKR